MKKLLPFLILILSLQGILAQPCSTDSIVKKFIRERGNDFANDLQTDSFDLTTGLFTRTVIRLSDSLVTLSIIDTFNTRSVSYNANQDTVAFLVRNGTGSGFVNNQQLDFTYNVSGQILTRILSAWNGSAWNTTRTETWQYDGNNQVTDYTLTDTSGNVNRITYSYIGNRRQSILHEAGSGITWMNEQLFTIIYAGAIRDSLTLLKFHDAVLIYDNRSYRHGKDHHPENKKG